MPFTPSIDPNITIRLTYVFIFFLSNDSVNCRYTTEYAPLIQPVFTKLVYFASFFPTRSRVQFDLLDWTIYQPGSTKDLKLLRNQNHFNEMSLVVKVWPDYRRKQHYSFSIFKLEFIYGTCILTTTDMDLSASSSI